MKRFMFLPMAILMAMVSFSLASCSSDDEDGGENSTTSTDYATTISGTYVGTVSVSNEVTNNAVYAKLSKVSSSMVKLEYEYINDGEAMNLNISKNGNIYTLTNSGSNATFTIYDKTLTITYSNRYGNVVTFIGTKD